VPTDDSTNTIEVTRSDKLDSKLSNKSDADLSEVVEAWPGYSVKPWMPEANSIMRLSNSRFGSIFQKSMFSFFEIADKAAVAPVGHWIFCKVHVLNGLHLFRDRIAISPTRDKNIFGVIFMWIAE